MWLASSPARLRTATRAHQSAELMPPPSSPIGAAATYQRRRSRLSSPAAPASGARAHRGRARDPRERLHQSELAPRARSRPPFAAREMSKMCKRRYSSSKVEPPVGIRGTGGHHAVQPISGVDEAISCDARERARTRSAAGTRPRVSLERGSARKAMKWRATRGWRKFRSAGRTTRVEKKVAARVQNIPKLPRGPPTAPQSSESSSCRTLERDGGGRPCGPASRRSAASGPAASPDQSPSSLEAGGQRERARRGVPCARLSRRRR